MNHCCSCSHGTRRTQLIFHAFCTIQDWHLADDEEDALRRPFTSVCVPASRPSPPPLHPFFEITSRHPFHVRVAVQMREIHARKGNSNVWFAIALFLNRACRHKVSAVVNRSTVVSLLSLLDMAGEGTGRVWHKDRRRILGEALEDHFRERFGAINKVNGVLKSLEF